jgi:hypothetical protein
MKNKDEQFTLMADLVVVELDTRLEMANGGVLEIIPNNTACNEVQCIPPESDWLFCQINIFCAT